ncbi:MAG TPA: TIGR01777 family protein [Nitrospiraceae bacterium]|jgi:uncharacterized protein (TIGR01777 family)|nr:TIGR01777 family protein [Nitrospiraceae bacterium]
MSGATGFIGSHLTRAFENKGWKVIPLRRDDFSLEDEIWLRKFEHVDVVINLAGTTIATRWTEEYKKQIVSSRIDTTKRIVLALKEIPQKPRLFISASAVGIYRAEGVHTEEDTNYATDFLGKLAFQWEQEALKAKEAGIRMMIFRLGVVLGPDGGPLQKMLVPFRTGLGGVVGDGKQPFSWVHIEDLIRAYLTAIENEQYEGIYNLTAPNPTTNAGLSKALGKALHRPTFMRIPGFAVKLKLGDAAILLTSGQHALPKRLTESGFVFQFPEIETAIIDLVKPS